jgi:hypothetical protein
MVNENGSTSGEGRGAVASERESLAPSIEMAYSKHMAESRFDHPVPTLVDEEDTETRQPLKKG